MTLMPFAFFSRPTTPPQAAVVVFFLLALRGLRTFGTAVSPSVPALSRRFAIATGVFVPSPSVSVLFSTSVSSPVFAPASVMVVVPIVNWRG